jgi:hypothetical protein
MPSSARHAIDLAFGIALAIQFASLSEFILLPEQVDKIRRAVDLITLRLDYIKSVEWLQAWLSTARRMNLVERLFKVLCGLAAVPVVVLFIVIPLTMDELGWMGRVVAMAGMLLVLSFAFWCAFRLLMKVWWLFGQPTVDWLASQRSLSRLLAAYVTVAVLGAVVFGYLTFTLALTGLNSPAVTPGSALAVVRDFARLAVIGLGLIWFVVIIDGALAFAGAFAVLIARFAIAVARATMWRIARFHKGPVAAMTLLITVAFAVLHLFIAIK